MATESRVPLLIGIYAFTTFLSTFFICLRLYARIAIVHVFGLDDWTMLVAGVRIHCTAIQNISAYTSA